MSSDSLFSPFDGGPPLGWLQRRFGLWPLAQPPRTAPRTALVVLVVWVPLLILAAVQGHALGPARQAAFRFDAAARCRDAAALDGQAHAGHEGRRHLKSLRENDSPVAASPGKRQ